MLISTLKLNFSIIFIIFIFCYGFLYPNYETDINKIYSKSDSLSINRIYEVADSLVKIPGDSAYIVTLIKRGIYLSDSVNIKLVKAEGYKRLGIYFRHKGDYQTALENFFEALEIVGKKSNNWQTSSILNNIGVVYRRLDDYNTALDYHLKALTIAEEIQDKRNIAVSLNSIGNIHTFIGNYQEGLEHFFRAMKIEERDNNQLGKAINFNNIGEVYVLLKKTDSAKVYFEHSLSLNIELKNNKGIAINLNCLGNLSKESGKLDLALEYFKRALELDKQSGDKIYILRSYNNIGELQLLMNNAKSALLNFNLALELALELGSKFEIHRSYKFIADAYRKIGNFEKALINYDYSKIYGDSVLNEKNNNSIAHLQIRYNLEKKEKQIELLQKEKQNESNFKVFLLIIIIIILIFAFISYRRFKIQRDLSISLEDKNKIIEQKNWELLNMNEKIQEQNTILESLNLTLTEKNSEIIKTQKHLLNLNEQLKDANNTKDKFFSIISHDLKNPFNYLLATTDMLRERFNSYSPENIYSKIENLNESAHQVYNLLDNLLNWANSQRGVIKYNPSDFDFYEIAINNVLLLKPLADKKGITIKSMIKPNTYIYADYNMVNTIARNFLSNAVKFTNSGGSVEIHSYKDDDYLYATVVDTGIGLNVDFVPKLFSIDENISTKGTANESGTGLGLVMCKEFTERNGGKIEVKSEIGVGSKFTFSLPLSKIEVDFANSNPINEIDEIIQIPIAEIPELIFVSEFHFKYLNNELAEKRNYVMKYKQIGLIKEFVESVMKIGIECNSDYIIEYANKLEIVLNTFDFEKIIRTLLDFDLILERVKISE